MNNIEQKIYRLDDEISFRECTLAKEYSELEFGDCTKYMILEEAMPPCFRCKQHGIHFHCTKHPEIEFEIVNRLPYLYFKCEKCNKEVRVEDIDKLIQESTRLLNMKKFKNAKLIRINDFYYPEIKKKVKLESDYWMSIDIKKDKDGDTMIVLYVGEKNSKDKSQFFIKPEKLQVSNDYKDLDPATILSKIEVTLRNRKITQKYDEEDM